MRESQTARLSFAFLVLLNQIAAVYKTVTKFCAGMILKRDQQSKSETSIRKTVLLASLGVDEALRSDPLLRMGLNTFKGQCTHPAVATSLGYDLTDPMTLLGA